MKKDETSRTFDKQMRNAEGISGGNSEGTSLY
jgi:hypothetical protein